MDKFIDNLAHELAKPTSRRSLMRLIGGAMFGGLAAAWMPASLEARECSPTNPCPGNQPCCTEGPEPFCAPSGHFCCGATHCNPSEQCCGTSGSKFCAKAKDQTCCGSTTCNNDETCCGNRNCCAKGHHCDHSNGNCAASKSKKKTYN